MAEENISRTLLPEHIASVLESAAVPGTPVYAKLANVDQSLLDGATDIGAMQAARVAQDEINIARGTLMSSVTDPDVRSFLEKITSKSQEEAKSVLAEGGTISTVGGRILWNSEQKLPDSILRNMENAGYTPNEKDLARLTELYHTARIEGALLDVEAGANVSRSALRNTAQDLFKEDRSAGDKAAGIGRKTARIVGTGVGGAVAAPLFVLGGAGGFVVGVARKVGHAITGHNRQTKENLRTMKDNVAATTTVENWREASEAQAGLHSQRKDYGGEIGKGIKWGAIGGAGLVTGGAVAGNRFANLITGGRGAKKEQAIGMMILEEGLKDGVKAQGGIVVEDIAKEEKKAEEVRKQSDAGYEQTTTAQNPAVATQYKASHDGMDLSTKLALVKAGTSIEEAFKPAALKVIDIDRAKSDLPTGRENEPLAIIPKGLDPARFAEQLKIMNDHAPDKDIKLVTVEGTNGEKLHAFLGISGAEASAYSGHAAAVAAEKAKSGPQQQTSQQQTTEATITPLPTPKAQNQPPQAGQQSGQRPAGRPAAEIGA